MSDTFGKGLGSLIPGGAHPAPKPPSQTVLPPHDPQEGEVFRVLTVATQSIEVNPKNPRTFFDPDKIKDLERSIAQHGILEPLIVTEKGGGRFELIAGERRLRAARNLGLAKVPVTVRHADDLERLELSLIENLQRQDLNSIEEAEGYRELIEAFGLTQEEAARKVGKSRETIANLLRVLELPSDMQKACAQGQLTLAHARLLLSVDNPKSREQVFKDILTKGLTVRETEELTVPSRKRKKSGIKDPEVLADEARLRETLNTKVQIEKRGSAGRVVIHFYSDEDYGELVGKLSGG
ncbi:ParB/RepB/Spo0J family partition protein [Candidatus Uhrbacteria bacterium]|nr:ParB/RepB/Spo0J family partition protein [Candidatus Uhrbacteria bacterium]